MALPLATLSGPLSVRGRAALRLPARSQRSGAVHHAAGQRGGEPAHLCRVDDSL